MPKSPKYSCHDFEVRTSTIKDAGLGLFTRQTIQTGETIGYYTGEIIDEKAFLDPDRPFSPYLLWVCRSHIILGEGPRANYTRYINHSDQPNAFLVVSTRWKSARFEALMKIHSGEEIFFNYGDEYWDS